MTDCLWCGESDSVLNRLFNGKMQPNGFHKRCLREFLKFEDEGKDLKQ